MSRFDTDEKRAFDEPLLSPVGERRRLAMLVTLKRTVVRRRRRRTAARLGIVAIAVAGIAVGLMVEWRPREAVPGGSSSDIVQEAETRHDRANPAVAGDRIEVVRDRPGSIERYAIATKPPKTRYVENDAELFELLRAAGVDSGLVRIEGRVYLDSELLAGVSTE